MLEPSPAIISLNNAIPGEMAWGQALIRRQSLIRFELRHSLDAEMAADSLNNLRPHALRVWSDFDENGRFRALKSAPTLRRGWRMETGNLPDLERALNELYPGSVADWHAVETARATPVSYREFTGRQTGMYRITTLPSDERVAALVRSACHPDSCLKCRLWPAPGGAPDTAPPKSLIPCLEPCAPLLEFARTIARMDQAEGLDLHLSPGERETLIAALEYRLRHDRPEFPDGRFREASNPRKMRLMLDHLQTLEFPARNDLP